MARSILLYVDRRSPLPPYDCDHGYQWAIEAGFDGVELALCDDDLRGAAVAVDHDVPDAFPAPGRHQGILAVSTRCVATRIDAAQAEVTTLLHRAAGLGATCLNLSPAAIERNGQPAGFKRYQDALNFTHDLLRRTRSQAERSGVVVAVEAATDGFLLSPVEMREMLSSLSSWSVGACIDIHRVAKYGSPQDWLLTLNAQVQCVRLNCASPNGGATPGPDESENTQAIIEALDEIGYDRLIVVKGSGDLHGLRGDADMYDGVR